MVAQPVVVRRRGFFFPLFAAFLLSMVLLGFSRTLYLRPWFTDEPMPAYLYVHGAVLTLWFVFFFSQTLLIARGRVWTHRRAGAFGGVLAVLVVAVALAAVFDIVDRFRSVGVDVEAARGQISMIAWGNLAALTAFSLFIGRGILKRNTPEAHKRLMLLGSISIMSPAYIRISDIPPFAMLGGVLFTLVALLATAGALVLHDLIALRKIHRETLWGVPFFFIALLGSAFLLPGTGIDAWLQSMLW